MWFVERSLTYLKIKSYGRNSIIKMPVHINNMPVVRRKKTTANEEEKNH